jgi:hypothetical protein
MGEDAKQEAHVIGTVVRREACEHAKTPARMETEGRGSGSGEAARDRLVQLCAATEIVPPKKQLSRLPSPLPMSHHCRTVQVETRLCLSLFGRYAKQAAGTAVLEHPKRAVRPDLYVTNAMADIPAFHPLGGRAGDNNANEGLARQAAH